MVDKLITGIAQAIRGGFPEESYLIYTEKTEQGIQEPCFFILCVTQDHTAKLGGRFWLNTSFDVHYFPEVGNDESWKVAETLRELLEWIMVDGNLIRGTSINYRVEDEVFHFFIDYNLPMTHSKDAVEFMEEVKIHGKTRG